MRLLSLVADTCDALIEMNGAATPTSEATCLTTSDEASPITSGEPCWIRPATWSIAALGVSEVTPLTDKSPPKVLTDRKSTRLNSSHRTISYAVFCLKKKKNR